jgi:hypothetical protein
MQPPITETKAWTYAMLNVAAAPGLGSLLARRWFSGTVQLVIALAGCGLVLGWFVQKMRLFYGQIFGTNLPMDAGDLMGKWGVAVFVVAWIWSLMTSIQIVQAAKRNGESLTTPPIISKLSGENR